ncbi:MAG: hypothetical protein IVW53_01340 [Chloroflexi bacterium]|nr:hypothetical protein [Chloroflexota bacterium]
MDRSVVVGLTISVLALAVSLTTYWRTELRGPRTACLSVPGSTVVAIGRVDDPSPRLLVNVWRDLLFTNDGHRPAYISLVESKMPTLPAGLAVQRADVGVVDHLAPVAFHRLEALVDRDKPLRLTVAWWLVLSLDDEGRLRDIVRDPNGALSMVVGWTALESLFIWPRFKPREITVRPIAFAGELIAWRERPYGM